jgi:hypothetical protein
VGQPPRRRVHKIHLEHETAEDRVSSNIQTNMENWVYHRIYGEGIKLIVIVVLWIMWVTGKLSTAAFFRFFEEFDFAPEQVVENPLEE